MNKSSLKYHFIILGLFISIGCSDVKDKSTVAGSSSKSSDEVSTVKGAQKTIIVYGSEQCNHCHEFRRKLESKGIEYEFRDVDANDIYYLELQKLIQSINYKGYVKYPVIDIEGEIFVNPDFLDVESKMFSNNVD